MEDFCVHAQKFQIMILDNKVFQHWIICAYTQILNKRRGRFLHTCAEIPNNDFGHKVFQHWIICAYTQILNRDVEDFCIKSARLRLYSSVGKFNSCSLSLYAGIYVFHTWSFCAGRKTSTIGLFELFIIRACSKIMKPKRDIGGEK